MGHNIIHTVYKDILLFKQNVHQIKLLFHGSRITVLNLPYKGVLLFKQNVHQIKLLFHGSRITVLTFTVISIGIKGQESNQAIFYIKSSYFFTGAV